MLATYFGNVLLTAADYDKYPATRDMVCTILAYFAAMWVVEWVSLAVMKFACPMGPVLGKAKNRGERNTSTSP